MMPMYFYFLLAFFLFLSILPVYFYKSSNNIESYFVGDRNINGIIAGISMMATHTSAITFLSAPAWGYDAGFQYISLYLALPLVAGFVLAFFVPLFLAKPIITAYEMVGDRLGEESKKVSALLSIVLRIVGIGGVIYAPSLVISTIVDIPIALCIITIGILTTLYTLSSGIKGVIYTDFTQTIFFVVSMILIIFFLFFDLNDKNISIPSILQNTYDFSKSAGGYNFFAGFFGGFILYLSYFGTEQSQVQRILSSKNKTHTIYALWIGVMFVFILMFLFLFIGIMLKASFPEGSSIVKKDLILLTFVMSKFHYAISAFIIAGILGAAMSSLDSALNGLSSIIVRDFYVGKNNDKTLFFAKIITFILGMIATGYAFVIPLLGSSMLLIVNKTASFIAGPVLGIFLLAIMGAKVRKFSVIFGTIIGILLTIYFGMFNFSWLYNPIIGTFSTMFFIYYISLKDKSVFVSFIAGISICIASIFALWSLS